MNLGRREALSAAYWATPPLLCLLLHWLCFTAWFRADDFAWLSNGNAVHSIGDLAAVLFTPQAQGTIRPWSDRLFFVLGYSLFGWDILPFRIAIFASQFASLALVTAIGNRITQSRAAGFWAAILWSLNTTMTQPLGWVSAYNQVLCGLFLLTAFYFLLKFTETGERRYEGWQWAAFLLGFGALELNVVYPVLAAGYTFLCAQKYFRRTLPLFAVSAVYTVVHMSVATLPKTGLYQMHFGTSLLRTLGIYWLWSVGPTYVVTPLHVRRAVLLAIIAVLTLALAWFALRHRRFALFCLLWYVVLLAPLLPLRDHLSEYYPYLPVIGLCWLGGWGIASLDRNRAAAVALLGLYIFLMVPRIWDGSRWNWRLTQGARKVVEGVAHAHELHPNAAILLDGVDSDLFFNAVADHPFRIIGFDRVYLTPESVRRIAAPGGWRDPREFVLPPGTLLLAMQRGEAEVYDVRGALLRNITSEYASTAHSEALPSRLDVADPLYAGLLGPGWYPADGDHRWMAKRATLRLAGPAAPGLRLYLMGTAEGAVSLTVHAGGIELPHAAIAPQAFSLVFPLPAALTGRPEIEIAVEVSRTFTPPGDNRPLGLAFGTFEIR